jgi:bifunctional non-homologous end joining protein LigD
MSAETETVAGVDLTNPDRVLYPDGGPNKHELALYLEAAAKCILPFVKRHPLSLVRCPDGIAKHCFFQKHLTAGMPEGFHEAMITESDGDRAPYLYIEDVAGLVGAAQISALELHVWGASIDDLEHPDRLVFDLDPGEDVCFDDVRTAARDIRDLLAAAKLPTYPLLTGGKGIHVIAPLSRKNDWPEVKGFAEAIARSLERQEPDRFIASARKSKRKGRIFIDWLRNERGATAIAPYSPRARKGAAVAMPVSWTELGKVKAANAYDTATALRRIAGLRSDPWKGYAKGARIAKQTLAAALKASTN